MDWGKQETYDLLKAAVLEQGSYDEVFGIVRKDVLPILYYKGLSVDDAEDVLQEIYFSILIHAAAYLKKSEKYTEKQRNAWLRKIIKSKVSDFFRVYYRQQKLRDDADEDDDADGHANTDIGNSTVSLDGENGTSDIPDMTDYFTKTEESHEKLYTYFKKLFSLKTTPDKLVAFVYNKIVCNDYRGIITYKTSYISAKFYGKEVGMLALTVKPQLEITLGVRFPDEVMQPLLDKLSTPDKKHDNIPFETAPFDLTPRQITDSSNWILKKFAEVIRDVDETFED